MSNANSIANALGYLESLRSHALAAEANATLASDLAAEKKKTRELEATVAQLTRAIGHAFRDVQRVEESRRSERDDGDMLVDEEKDGAVVSESLSSGDDPLARDRDEVVDDEEQSAPEEESISNTEVPTRLETDRLACPDCDRTFANKSGLGAHRAAHERVTHGRRPREHPPFRCPSCGNTYTRKENLKSHISRKHLNLF
jgi:rubrerythrin